MKAKLVRESNIPLPPKDNTIGEANKKWEKEKLLNASKEYNRLKRWALSRYLDVIDFPPEIKSSLSRLSALKSKLKRSIDPEREYQRDARRWDKETQKRKSNTSILRKLKKEIIEKYPEAKIAEKIVSLWKYDKKKAQKILDNSSFENISRVKEYVLDARFFQKQRKNEEKVQGYISF